MQHTMRAFLFQIRFIILEIFSFRGYFVVACLIGGKIDVKENFFGKNLRPGRALRPKPRAQDIGI